MLLLQTQKIHKFYFLSHSVNFCPIFTGKDSFEGKRQMIFWSLRSQKCQVKRKKIMDSRTWNLMGKYLKTGHLRFFSSENKKRPKNLLVSDDVLKICYFFCFWSSKLPKTVFFSEIITKKIKIGPKSKSVSSKSCFKLDILFHTTFFILIGLVWYGLVIVL